MFDKDSLRDVAEVIVYANLLIAILAVIVLYDQRRVNDQGELADEEWQQAVEKQLKELNDKIDYLEECLTTVCTMLQNK